MRINSKAGTQSAAFDGSDAGEGLAIFLSQNGDAVSRYRFLVKAMLGEGVYQVGTFYSSPPGATTVPGRLTRMVAAAICPGATSWELEVSCADNTITPETADVVMASSKCCTAPVGVSRVDERYGLLSGSAVAPQTLNLLPGQTITRIVLIGRTGGGTFNLDGGTTVTIDAGASIAFEPKGPIRFGATALHFSGVDWAVEFLESA